MYTIRNNDCDLLRTFQELNGLFSIKFFTQHLAYKKYRVKKMVGEQVLQCGLVPCAFCSGLVCCSVTPKY